MVCSGVVDGLQGTWYMSKKLFLWCFVLLIWIVWVVLINIGLFFFWEEFYFLFGVFQWGVFFFKFVRRCVQVYGFYFEIGIMFFLDVGFLWFFFLFELVLLRFLDVFDIFYYYFFLYGMYFGLQEVLLIFEQLFRFVLFFWGQVLVFDICKELF